MLYFFTETQLMLSPFGVGRVCPDGDLAITCSTDRNFLEWNITPSFTILGPIPYRTRLVSASDQAIDSLVLNMISFDFSVHSSLYTNGTSVSLVSVLSVTSVPDILNGTRVHRRIQHRGTRGTCPPLLESHIYKLYS